MGPIEMTEAQELQPSCLASNPGPLSLSLSFTPTQLDSRLLSWQLQPVKLCSGGPSAQNATPAIPSLAGTQSQDLTIPQTSPQKKERIA